jgi:hypothetical protein
MNPRRPAGPPMTLGNMRGLGEGDFVTKMTATVHVEFELLEGQADNMANTALIGGVGALKLAIERGGTGTGQTGVKPGTVQANIVDQKIT